MSTTILTLSKALIFFSCLFNLVFQQNDLGGNSFANTVETKPNLLIIHTDEHNFRTLGAYRETLDDDHAFIWGENVYVSTPHIDALAKGGALCTSYYATSPVCTPSRASLVSGLYPIATGSPRNDMPLNDGLITFAEILKRQGYSTSYLGKWHLDGDAKPGFAPKRKFGFDDNRYMFNRGHWKMLEETIDGPGIIGEYRPANDRYQHNINEATEQSFTTDFTPTILGIMGLDKQNPDFHGMDASADFLGSEKEVHSDRIVYITSAASRWVAAVNSRYKLVLSPTDKPWLFDLQNDPDELINCYNDVEYRHIATTFKARLIELMKQYDEPIMKTGKLIYE